MTKKIISLTLIALLLFSLLSCGQAAPDTPEKTPEKALKIGVLSGTTGMGAAKMIEDLNKAPSEKYESIKIYSDPSAIMSDMISKNIDIAAMPTNAAATLYNKSKGGVKVIALNTLGVLYLLDNTGEINSLSDLSGKTIHVATPGQTPEYILKNVLNKAGITDVTFSTEYTDMDTLASKLAAGKNADGEYFVKIALLPEPKVTVALNQAKANGNANLKVAIDLTAEWDKLEENPVTQGCVVVQKDVLEQFPASVDAFLADYEKSIVFITNTENLDAAANTIANVGIIPKAPIAKMALPKCNIVYVDGEKMKATLEDFLKTLYEMDKTAIGGALPDEEFYYIPQ